MIREMHDSTKSLGWLAMIGVVSLIVLLAKAPNDSYTLRTGAEPWELEGEYKPWMFGSKKPFLLTTDGKQWRFYWQDDTGLRAGSLPDWLRDPSH